MAELADELMTGARLGSYNPMDHLVELNTLLRRFRWDIEHHFFQPHVSELQNETIRLGELILELLDAIAQPEGDRENAVLRVLQGMREVQRSVAAHADQIDAVSRLAGMS